MLAYVNKCAEFKSAIFWLKLAKIIPMENLYYNLIMMFSMKILNFYKKLQFLFVNELKYKQAI